MLSYNPPVNEEYMDDENNTSVKYRIISKTKYICQKTGNFILQNLCCCFYYCDNTSYNKNKRKHFVDIDLGLNFSDDSDFGIEMMPCAKTTPATTIPNNLREEAYLDLNKYLNSESDSESESSFSVSSLSTSSSSSSSTEGFSKIENSRYLVMKSLNSYFDNLPKFNSSMDETNDSDSDSIQIQNYDIEENEEVIVRNDSYYGLSNLRKRKSPQQIKSSYDDMEIDDNYLCE
jgi:hypothetical protein